MLTTLSCLARLLSGSKSFRLASNPRLLRSCCHSSSSSSSDPPDDHAAAAASVLRIGIQSMPSSLPLVMNQFESYILSELQSRCGSKVQVIRVPHEVNQDADDGDHVRDQQLDGVIAG